mmetsp:Transcript_14991/g.30837  ORF Transcript_14991/g.30837 Transcript_14991/m.30837 type:complete len:118 (+) Transcript_14991:751-1104(+)
MGFERSRCTFCVTFQLNVATQVHIMNATNGSNHSSLRPSQYIDPEYTYTNFSLEDQDKILKAGRSNNELNCNKLVEAVPECKINEIHDACELVFQRMKENLTADGTIPDKLFKRAKA